MITVPRPGRLYLVSPPTYQDVSVGIVLLMTVQVSACLAIATPEATPSPVMPGATGTTQLATMRDEHVVADDEPPTISPAECAIFSAAIREMVLSGYTESTLVLLRERTIEGIRDAVSLDQRELADALGANPEFMTVLVERWKRPGFITNCLTLDRPYKLLTEEEIGRRAGSHPMSLRKVLYYRYPGSTALVGMTRPAISDSGKKAVLYFETWWGGSVLYLFRATEGWRVVHEVELWEAGQQPEIP